MHYYRALEIARKEKHITNIVQFLINLTELAELQQHLSLARQYAKQAYELLATTDTSFLQIRLLIVLCRVELRLHNLSSAQQFAVQALIQAAHLNDTVGTVGSRSLLALIAHRCKKDDSARYHIQHAIKILETMQSKLDLSKFKAIFLSQAADVYALAAWLAASQGQAEEAFYWAEKSRARAYLDQISDQPIKLNPKTTPLIVMQAMEVRREIIRLETNLRNEYAKPNNQQQKRLMLEWQQSLGLKQTAYQHLLLELKGSNPKYVSLINSDVLTLQQIQEHVLDKKTTLIAYFTIDELISQQTLVWAIDQKHVKLVLLQSGQNELTTKVVLFRKAIEAQTEVTAKSMRLYEDLITPMQSHIQHENLIIIPHGILYYLPFATLWDVRKKQYLVEQHIISYAPIASMIPKFQTQQISTKCQVPTLGSVNYKLVNPLFSRIELFSSLCRTHPFEIHEIYNLDLDEANPVILSVGNLAVSEFSRGDEISHLVQAFFYASTAGLVYTLWTIDPGITTQIMNSFLRYRKDGMNDTEALNHAQREILTQEEYGMCHIAGQHFK